MKFRASPIEHTTILVLACSAHADHGRRVHRLSEQQPRTQNDVQQRRQPGQYRSEWRVVDLAYVKPFAKLLLAFNNAALGRRFPGCGAQIGVRSRAASARRCGYATGVIFNATRGMDGDPTGDEQVSMPLKKRSFFSRELLRRSRRASSPLEFTDTTQQLSAQVLENASMAGSGEPLELDGRNATAEKEKSRASKRKAVAQKASEAYSWSVDKTLDAYSWSVEVGSNATAAVTSAVSGLQFPALFPNWFRDWFAKELYTVSKALDGIKFRSKVMIFLDKALKLVSGGSGEGRFVLLLGIVWLCESAGILSLAALSCLVAAQRAWTPLGLYLGSEALFYMLCLGLARRSNSIRKLRGRPFADLPPERRRELWRRVLRDPSQSPRDFIEGWFYFEDRFPQFSPFKIILRWMFQRLAPWLDMKVVPNVYTPAMGSGGRRLVEAYGVPWEELSVGDVYSFLCRNLYGKQRCADLTPAEDLELRELVSELEKKARISLPKRLIGQDEPRAAQGERSTAQFDTTPGIASMCGQMDPLRWRHRPLLYYFLSHWLYGICYTRRLMQKNGFKHRKEGKLSYWHRPGSRRSGRAPSDAFVFIHGIGFGVAPYVQRVKQMAGDTDILMIELTTASQRLFPRMPSTSEFPKLVVAALDTLNLQRCVVAGHSLGSMFASILAQHDARTEQRRVGGVALLDPVAPNIHHSRTARKVIYSRLDSAQASFEDFFFKKELWTINLLQRHLPWHEVAFWLDDCKFETPTLIAVGSSDQLVDAASAREGFGSWRGRFRGVRVLTMPDSGHGAWVFNETMAVALNASVHALRDEAAKIGAAEEQESIAARLKARASASLAAATDPFSSRLRRYQEALAGAEQARTDFEEQFARAETEAELSYKEFESKVSLAASQSQEKLPEGWKSKIQRRLAAVRGTMEQEYTGAADVVASEAKRKLSVTDDTAELLRFADVAEAEAKRARNPVLRNVARAVSEKLPIAEKARKKFRGRLRTAKEVAAVKVAEAQKARDEMLASANRAFSKAAARAGESLGINREPAKVKDVEVAAASSPKDPDLQDRNATRNSK